uniref:Histone H2A/H2B/H3 domain-containing protein n=1 Tax=Panagrellus redivivus TaxID=6233 RepID=A0A7E4URS5_PANRE
MKGSQGCERRHRKPAHNSYHIPPAKPAFHRRLGSEIILPRCELRRVVDRIQHKPMPMKIHKTPQVAKTIQAQKGM